jgi:2'-5' RNA ligase
VAPNWFIAFPMHVEGLDLPTAPPRVRLFGAADLHVTLGFLGTVQHSEALAAWAELGRFRSLRSVRGTFGGVKPLGNPRKPSALSAIVDKGREAMSEMIAEARGPLLSAAGADPDDRPPLPHMTIARIQRRARGPERRQALRWAEALDLSKARFTASSVALYTWSTDRQERLFQIVEQHPMPS